MSRIFAACRPVDMSKMPDVGEVPPVYPGSVIERCSTCGERIYVGPRQQALDVPKVCFLCGLARPGVQGVIDLGNPFKRQT